jgi:flagellar assembly protein FliH
MAGIIRKETVTRTAAFSFADLEQQGRAIIERAQAEAREILAAAQRHALGLAERERCRALEEGRAEGLAEGRAAGLEQIRAEAHAAAMREAQADVQRLTQSLQAALAEFDQHKRSLITAAESGLIELALRVARRVCKLEAGRSIGVALANGRALLDMAQHAEDPELCFNPADLEMLKESGAQLAAAVQQFSHVKLVADEKVERGGCLLRTRAGEIDAGLETQVQRIAEALCVTVADVEPAPPSAPSPELPATNARPPLTTEGNTAT